MYIYSFIARSSCEKIYVEVADIQKLWNSLKWLKSAQNGKNHLIPMKYIIITTENATNYGRMQMTDNYYINTKELRSRQHICNKMAKFKFHCCNWPNDLRSNKSKSTRRIHKLCSTLANHGTRAFSRAQFYKHSTNQMIRESKVLIV